MPNEDVFEKEIFASLYDCFRVVWRLGRPASLADKQRDHRRNAPDELTSQRLEHFTFDILATHEARLSGMRCGRQLPIGAPAPDVMGFHLPLRLRRRGGFFVIRSDRSTMHINQSEEALFAPDRGVWPSVYR